jgi:hypothetical protein
MHSTREIVASIARATFAHEVRTRKAMLCSEREYVSQILRDVGLERLADTEALYLSHEQPTRRNAGLLLLQNAKPSEPGNKSRELAIEEAKAGYRAELDSVGERGVLAYERNWVDQALRDKSYRTTNDDEARAFSLKD